MTAKKELNPTIIELFEAQVAKNPTLIALKDKSCEYTYSTLNDKANQLAHHLKSQSVELGDFVALLLEPGADFIICLVAIIKLGAIYIPLDTHAPKTRLNTLLEDATPRLIITNELSQRQFSETNIQCYVTNQLYLDSAHCSKENINTTITPALQFT